MFVLLAGLAFLPLTASSETTCEDADVDGVLSIAADGTGECATIQDAIDISDDGGVIELGDGTYQENLEIDGKYLTITGNTDDPSAVIIDANYAGRGLYISNTESGDTELSGLTFINGREDNGGAIYIYVASANITDCIFYDNEVIGSGGAISLYSVTADTTVNRSTFYSNHAGSGGGAIYTSYIDETGNLIVKNSVFYDNDASRNGGAIHAGVYAYPAI